MNTRLKIFVSAFSCMPGIGSEPGVGWHWVLEMSKYFELWVLVHKEQVVDIEEYVKDHGLDKRIHFIYFDIPLNSWFFKDGKFRWVRTYYYLWTKMSNKIVKKTMEENDIEIFHMLTFGNAIWGISKYGQKRFFIWGPTGGVDTIPKEYSKYFDWKGQAVEMTRRTIVRFLKIDPGFNRRCKNANLILCKSEYMRNTVPEKYREKAIIFTDVAVEPNEKQTIKTQEGKDTIDYIIVGRLDSWRGFDLTVEAFAKAYKENQRIRLKIVGSGMDYNRIISLVNKYKLQKVVTLTGEVAASEYREIISDCDVVVNAALKEAAVTVSFDCMKYGKPLICVDSKGYTRYFSNDYAIVLPMITNRDKMIDNLSGAILSLTDDDLRAEMGQKVQNVGEEFIWSKKGELIRDAILKAYTNKA